MSEIVAIAIGGALGALSRFWATNLANILFGTDFPYGILIINVLGSFAIGVLFILLVERSLMPTALGTGLIVGFLGAFTTFSTFSLQALGLLESGRLLAAAAYIGGSVVICISAAGIGMFVARLVP
jgi:CrcB protein